MSCKPSLANYCDCCMAGTRPDDLLVGTGCFTFATGNNNRSRLRRLKNGVSQGSVLAPILFNVYTSDLPTTAFSKHAYADESCMLMKTGKKWKEW